MYSAAQEDPTKRYIWGTAYKFSTAASNSDVTFSVTAAKELSMTAQHILDQHFSSKRPLTLAERGVIYNDPAMRLTSRELMDLRNLENFPVCDSHKRTQIVGHIVDGFIMQDELKILAKITDPATIQKLDSKEYEGLSVGYSRRMDGSGALNGLEFREVSVCKTPFFDGCNIAETAQMTTPATTTTLPNLPDSTGAAVTAPVAAAPAAAAAAVPSVVSAQEFRALSEKYDEMKRNQQEYESLIAAHRESQKPIMEKTILNLARITNKLDPTDKQAPIKFSPEVQTFLTNQFTDLKNKDMASLFTTISDRFEEAGSKYEALQAQATGYQQQLSDIQKQNLDLKSLLDKQTSEQQKRASAAASSASNKEAQVSSLVSDIFHRAYDSSPIDALFGNVRSSNKRSYEKMAAASAVPSSKEVSQEASRDLPDEEQATKKVRLEASVPEGVAPSHARLFNSLAGIKHQVNMRDPNRYLSLPNSMDTRY